jgi:hypothetical protein
MEWSNPLAEAQWALPQRNGICSIFADISSAMARGNRHQQLRWRWRASYENRMLNININTAAVTAKLKQHRQ